MSKEHSLVMPFIVCESEGGPYEDTAFTAGYSCGLIDAELRTCANLSQGMLATPATRWVKDEIMPQLDLIAMQHGYCMSKRDDVESDDPSTEGWTVVWFTPAQAEEDITDG